MSKTKMGLALALALAGIPAAAFAGDNKQQDGWFVGLGYAQSGNSKLDDYTKWSTDMTSLDAGYRWAVGSNTAIGVELGGGTSSIKFTFDGLGSYTVNNASHAFFGMNGRTNFGKSPAFVLYRAGMYSESFRMDGVNYSTDSSAYVGLGIGADLNKHFNIQANYLHLSGSGGDPDRDAVQVGLEYRF